MKKRRGGGGKKKKKFQILGDKKFGKNFRLLIDPEIREVFLEALVDIKASMRSWSVLRL